MEYMRLQDLGVQFIGGIQKGLGEQNVLHKKAFSHMEGSIQRMAQMVQNEIKLCCERK